MFIVHTNERKNRFSKKRLWLCSVLKPAEDHEIRTRFKAFRFTGSDNRQIDCRESRIFATFCVCLLTRKGLVYMIYDQTKRPEQFVDRKLQQSIKKLPFAVAKFKHVHRSLYG